MSSSCDPPPQLQYLTTSIFEPCPPSLSHEIDQSMIEKNVIALKDQTGVVSTTILKSPKKNSHIQHPVKQQENNAPTPVHVMPSSNDISHTAEVDNKLEIHAGSIDIATPVNQDNFETLVNARSSTPLEYNKNIETCPLCFNIPNRALLLICCGEKIRISDSDEKHEFNHCESSKDVDASANDNFTYSGRMICSLCARNWFAKHKHCPFCRAHIPAIYREKGLPDAKKIQERVDMLEVVCPYSFSGCCWVGLRRDLKLHLTEKCIIAAYGEAEGIIPIEEFALDKGLEDNSHLTTKRPDSDTASNASTVRPRESTSHSVNIEMNHTLAVGTLREPAMSATSTAIPPLLHHTPTTSATYGFTQYTTQPAIYAAAVEQQGQDKSWSWKDGCVWGFFSFIILAFAVGGIVYAISTANR